MTVSEFIAYLQKQPQDLPVAYTCYSEQCLLEAGDIEIIEACVERSDGWIQDKRPGWTTRRYLLLPGN